MMQVIFYKAKKGNAVDKLIAFYTSTLYEKITGKWLDTYSHVELLFSDGYMFSASQRTGLTAYRKHILDFEKWEYIDIEVDEKEVRALANKYAGKAYDYLGVISFLGIGKQEDKKWFCSEVVAKCLGYKNTKISPNGLYRLLTK